MVSVPLLSIHVSHAWLWQHDELMHTRGDFICDLAEAGMHGQPELVAGLHACWVEL